MVEQVERVERVEKVEKAEKVEKVERIKKLVPQERQVLTTGFEPGEKKTASLNLVKSSVGTTDTKNGF